MNRLWGPLGCRPPTRPSSTSSTNAPSRPLPGLPSSNSPGPLAARMRPRPTTPRQSWSASGPPLSPCSARSPTGSMPSALPTGKGDLAVMIEGPRGRPPARRGRPIAGRAETAGDGGGAAGLPALCGQRRGLRGIVSALTAVGFRDGKADPALLAALKGPQGFSRAAAARALCKAGGNSSWKAVRPLLTDADPAVRLQAALALADAHDSQAIPVLIECLSDGPAPLGAKAEEYLARPGRGMDGPRSARKRSGIPRAPP